MPDRIVRTPFVGREQELQQLQDCLDSASSGQGRVILVAGEPGIGKTRLLNEFAVRAKAQSWNVLSGRAYESEGMAPYHLFSEALRHYIRTCPLEDLQAQLGAAAAEVASVVPDIGRRLRDLPPSRAADAENERYQLFESVCDFLLVLSQSGENRGLLLVLDDLHWADRPSLLLLQHLARRLASAPLLVAGAYRTVELSGDHALTAVLAELRREGLHKGLILQPFTQAEATVFIAVVSGVPAAPETVETIYRETAGNAFFVAEVVQQLQAEGRDLADPQAIVAQWEIPEGIRQVIRTRLSRLSAEANQVLQIGAVLGEGFSFELLSAASGIEEGVLLDALDEDLAAGMLREEDNGYHFSHALVRQTLYSMLNRPRRRRFHLRAAEAIERVYAYNLEPFLGTLGVHYRLAGAGADPKKAIDCWLQAGNAAQAVFAYEEAAVHWEAALKLMEEIGTAPERRAEVLERLGSLVNDPSLGLTKQIDHLEQALKIYEELGLEARVAEVHSRLGAHYSAFGPSIDVPRALLHLQAAEPVLLRRPEGPQLAAFYMGLASGLIVASVLRRRWPPLAALWISPSRWGTGRCGAEPPPTTVGNSWIPVDWPMPVCSWNEFRRQRLGCMIFRGITKPARGGTPQPSPR